MDERITEDLGETMTKLRKVTNDTTFTMSAQALFTMGGVLKELWRDLQQLGLDAPRFVPVPGGGVQLEWTLPRRELELEIRPSGDVDFLIVDADAPWIEGSIGTNTDSVNLSWVLKRFAEGGY